MRFTSAEENVAMLVKQRDDALAELGKAKEDALRAEMKTLHVRKRLTMLASIVIEMVSDLNMMHTALGIDSRASWIMGRASARMDDVLKE